MTRKTEWLSQLDRHRAGRAAAQHQDRDQPRRPAERAACRMDSARSGRSACRRRLPPSCGPGSAAATRSCQLAVQARADQQALEPLDQSRDDHRKALERCLAGAGRVVARGRRPPLRLAGVGRRRRRTRGQDARTREKHRSQADDARADLVREQLGLKAAEDDLAAWRTRWAEMMERLGLEPGAAPSRPKLILDKTQKLFETLHEYRDFQSRIRGIDRDAEQFAADVGDLARRVAPDLVGQPADTQARELSQAVPRGPGGLGAAPAALSQQRDGEERRLRAAENERDTARHAARIALPRGGCRLRPTTWPKPSAARPSGAGSRMTSATVKTSSSP